jgi:DoxX-like family
MTNTEKEKRAKWMKTAKWIYWGITIPLAVTMMMAGVGFILGWKANVDGVVTQLGYPMYVLKILGPAKFLGGIAILYGRFRTLKEWAYAGYAFNLAGAIASYVLVGSMGKIAIPAVLLFFVLVSYRQWKTRWM